jgi:YkoY family integral membrane protein
MNELLKQIAENPITSLAIVGNLILIESLLSVDNAAVLATMVKDLPKEQRNKALKYGIWGAYVFRGLALLFASVLLQIWWLKPLGGAYLLYLVYDWWKGKKTKTKEDDLLDKKNNWFYSVTVGRIGVFWSTVLLVELMDMAFSVDNVFAAVAFTNNIILVCLGVFIGILAMRFIAQWFVRLMETYTFLESSAFLVIAVLGFKLLISAYEHQYSHTAFSVFLKEHAEAVDLWTSLATAGFFLIPVCTSFLFGYPVSRKKRSSPKEL